MLTNSEIHDYNQALTSEKLNILIKKSSELVLHQLATSIQKLLQAQGKKQAEINYEMQYTDKKFRKLITTYRKDMKSGRRACQKCIQTHPKLIDCATRAIQHGIVFGTASSLPFYLDRYYLGPFFDSDFFDRFETKLQMARTAVANNKPNIRKITFRSYAPPYASNIWTGKVGDWVRDAVDKAAETSKEIIDSVKAGTGKVIHEVKKLPDTIVTTAEDGVNALGRSLNTTLKWGYEAAQNTLHVVSHFNNELKSTQSTAGYWIRSFVALSFFAAILWLIYKSRFNKFTNTCVKWSCIGCQKAIGEYKAMPAAYNAIENKSAKEELFTQFLSRIFILMYPKSTPKERKKEAFTKCVYVWAGPRKSRRYQKYRKKRKNSSFC